MQRLSSQHPHCDSQPPVTLAPGTPVPSDLRGHQAHAGNSRACRQTQTHKQKGTLQKSAHVTNTELTEGMLTEPSWPGRPVFIPMRDFLRATLACGWVPQAREVCLQLPSTPTMTLMDPWGQKRRADSHRPGMFVQFSLSSCVPTCHTVPLEGNDGALWSLGPELSLFIHEP